jgi:hypothetical protein
MSLLASFLRNHLGDSKASDSPAANQNWVSRVPLDIIIEIAERLNSLDDLLSLSITVSGLQKFSLTRILILFLGQSTRIYATLLPVLYSSVDLRSSRMCRATLEMFLSGRSDVTRHIRRLVVRPNHVERRSEPVKPIDEAWVVQSIIQLATSGRLPRLTTFLWDGSEMPQDDALWSTLRKW